MRSNNNWNKSLFSEQLSETQSGCFWIFNNSSFTEEDFTNLVRLGGRHKTKRTGVIGKFGLGFNSVYNITDIPSILSGQNLVFFDPNFKYLPNDWISSENPGIRILLNESKDFLKQYEDQFKPYENIFESKIISSDEKTYKGTLLRLPFRKSPSEISKTLYTEERAKQILNILFEYSESLLLFTQNLCKFGIYLLNDENNPENMVKIFEIEKSAEDFIKKHDININVTDLSTSEMQMELIKQSNILRIAGEMITNSVNDFNIDISLIIKISLSSYKSNLFPEIMNKVEEIYWFQTSKCLPLPKQFENDCDFFTTLPCTGICIKLLETKSPNKSVNYYLDQTGTNGLAFCFLPLPKKFDLKFHLNGNFHLTSTREDIINTSNDRMNVNRKKWNDFLKTSLASTLIEAFKNMIQKADYTMNDLISIWPLNLEESFKILETEFINLIFDYKLSHKVFKRNQTLYSINQCKILELEFNSEMTILTQNFLQQIYGEDYFILHLPELVWKSINEKEIILQNRINKIDFVRLFITNIEIFHKESMFKLLNYLLSEFSYDFKKSCLTEIGSILKDSACIPSNLSGKFRRPNELINKSSSLSELYSLEDDDVFTNDSVLEENMKILLEMGLIDKYLPYSMILERIETYLKEKHPKYSCWAILNNYLKTLNNESNSSSTYEEQIRKIKFIQAKFPLLKDKKRLKWFVEENNFKGMRWSLEDLYDDDCESLVFRVAPIFDSTKLDIDNIKLKYLFKLKKNDFKITVQQFNQIQNDWLDTPDDFKFYLNDHVHQYFLKFMKWLYDEDSGSSLDVKQLELPKNMFFLKLGETYNYYEAENIAIKVQYPSNKLMIKITSDIYTEILKDSNRLLLKLGVKEKFDKEYLLNLSKELFLENRNCPLDREMLELSINIVKELDTILEDIRSAKCIYLPDSKNILRTTDQMCMIDDSTEWLNTNDANIVNDDIPIGLLKKLKISYLKSHFIKKHMRGIAFGQQEQLKNRIRKLLDSYPNLFDIFKELIQNADDCGASEIVFILDTRTHRSKKIFSNEFSSLQGPALCCYNNQTFSENDLEAIKNLGMGNKSSEAMKIGQYGVGFNTVYHLTDAPQLFSNLENYLIFDPLCKHFPDLDAENPGWRISGENNSNPLNEYIDVRDSFMGHFDDIKSLSNGTMFRFALRTEESVISEKVFNIGDIEESMLSNKENLKNSMIFLKNIRKLKVKKILENDNVETIVDLERKFNNETDVNEYSEFIKYFKDLSTKKVIEIKKRIFNLNISINEPNSATFYKIISQIGFEQPFKISDLKHFPLASIAIPINVDLEKFKGSFYCFLPLPMLTTLPYHINGYFALINESRQGLFKLTDMKNQKLKWNQQIFNEIISNLILEAIKYIKESKEIEYLLDSNLINSHYAKYFPAKFDNYNDLAGYMNDMIKIFYDKLVSSEEKLVPVYKSEPSPKIEWFKITEKILYSNKSVLNWCTSKTFGWYNPNNQPIVNIDKEKLENICNLLLAFDFKLCTFEQLLNVINNDYNEKNKIKEITSTNILSVFKTINTLVGLDIKDTHFKDKSCLKLLLEFCLNENKNIEQELNETPLLLNISNRLQKFSLVSPVYKTQKNYKFFEKCPEKCIHDSFSNMDFQKLTKEITVNDLKTIVPFVFDKEKYLMKEVDVFNFELYPKITETCSDNIEELEICKLFWDTAEAAKEKLQNDSKNKKNDINFFLNEISNWAIIPVEYQDSLYLAPLRAAKTIYNKYFTSRYSIHKDLINIFEEFNLPVLEKSFKDTLTDIVIDLRKSDDIFKSISLLTSQYDHNPIKNVKKSTRKKFIETFSGMVNTNMEQKLFLSLKIFENLFGEIISIESKTVITLHEKIPLDGLEKIFFRSNYFINSGYRITFAQNDNSNICRNFIAFYERFITELNNLSFKEKLNHISAIREYCIEKLIPETVYSFKNVPQGLVENLKKLAFIKSSEQKEILVTASDFYDPNINMFKILMRKNADNFPGSPYNTNDWIKFLSLIGLKGKLDIKNNFKKYFDLIKNSYASSSINFDELISSFHDLYDCMDAFKEESQVYSLKLLKINENELTFNLFEFLKSLQFLINSIKNIEKIDNLESIKKLFKKIYKIIDEKKCNKEFLKEIKDLDLIFHELVKGKINYGWKLNRADEFIVAGLNETEQIENLLFVFPNDLAEYKSLFISLGSNKQIDYKLCVKLLAKLNDRMLLKLNDSEDISKQAMQVMRLLFKNCKEEENTGNAETLYLLNDALQLKESSDLYYVDKYNLNHLYLNERIKNCCLISLKTFSSHFEEYKVFNNNWSKCDTLRGLHKQHRIKPLSTEITSELIKNENFQIERDFQLENKLNDQQFINAFTSLLNINDDVSLKFISNFFTNMKIYTTKNLRTRAHYREELLENTEIEQSFHSEYDKNTQSLVFYKSTVFPIKTYDALSDCIIEELSSYFNQYKHLLQERKTFLIELLNSAQGNYDEIIQEYKKSIETS